MLKKVFSVFLLLLAVALIILGFSLKDDLNTYISRMMQNQLSSKVIQTEQGLVDSLYNYSVNNQSFEITFLEFGATGCSACKLMEDVMETVIQHYPTTVNVVFLNILKPENQNLMKYYGISSIPTQVFLNKKGEEIFRHNGYYAFDDLKIKFQALGITH